MKYTCSIQVSAGDTIHVNAEQMGQVIQKVLVRLIQFADIGIEVEDVSLTLTPESPHDALMVRSEDAQCQSTNHPHANCTGDLWQCEACKRWFCGLEGGEMDMHLCDDCFEIKHDLDASMNMLNLLQTYAKQYPDFDITEL